MQPEKEVFDEYSRSVSFLKGLNITEKLVLHMQFLSPKLININSSYSCSHWRLTKLLLPNFFLLHHLLMEILFLKKF